MLEKIQKLKNKLPNFWSKGENDVNCHVPDSENEAFILTIDGIKVGVLRCQNGEWSFRYTEEFKTKSEEYALITGFPDLNKEYRSQNLWPFFRIRIPGLNQPKVKEILETENINKDNEVALLKRFGKKTIANPYLLLLNNLRAG